MRIGGWIQTFSGKLFYPLDPLPGEVDITDIAHALAMKCRFSGHTKEFYSVAQHSVLGSDQVEDEEIAKWFLLHDAAEAYMFDAARPIKQAFPFIKEVEERLLKAVAIKFNLPWPMPNDIEKAVHEIDDRMLMTEKKYLLTKTDYPWDVIAKPYSIRIIPWTWQYAKERFLEVAKELGLNA